MQSPYKHKNKMDEEKISIEYSLNNAKNDCMAQERKS